MFGPESVPVQNPTVFYIASCLSLLLGAPSSFELPFKKPVLHSRKPKKSGSFEPDFFYALVFAELGPVIFRYPCFRIP